MNSLQTFTATLLFVFAMALPLGAAVSPEAVVEFTPPQLVTIPSDTGPVPAKIRERHFKLRIAGDLTATRTALFVEVPSKALYWIGDKDRRSRLSQPVPNGSFSSSGTE